MASLLDRIRSAAIATPALTALLGTNPFRWYPIQKEQGCAFPCVVAQVVSGNKTYSVNARLVTGNSRVQFTVWSVNTGSGFTTLTNVLAAMTTFFDTLNLTGIPGLTQYPNFIISDRDGFYAQTEPGNPQRLIDVMIFSNDTL